MDLEQQLRAALAPCEPGPEPETAVMARISAAARRKPSRVILFGTILAVAAAAVMLTARLRGTSAPSPDSVAVVAAKVVDASPPRAVAPALQPVEENPAPKASAAVTRPFTVRMMPLRNGATDAAGKAIDLFFASLLEGLRAVPGLTLIGPDQAASAGSAPTDYRLTIIGSGPVTGNKFNVNLAENLMDFPNGASGANSTMSFAGDIAPACAGFTAQGADQVACTDPVGLAAAVLDKLRKSTFPQDPSLQQQLQTQLLDSVRDPQQRAKTLAELASFGPRSRTTGKRMPGSDAVNGAIELAVTTTDPTLRAAIWQAMRDVGEPELVQPLVASLREDPDGEVRLQALNTLVENFAGDPRVRAALETAAQEDGRPLVRALAQRALSGDTDWKKYVVASLKDTSRPAAERLEALVHQICPPGPKVGSCVFRIGAGSTFPSIRDQLDDEAGQALAQVLPKAGTQPPVIKTAMSLLVAQLGSFDGPVVTNALLDILDQTAELPTRTAIVRQLNRRTADSRVRTALEKISTGDGDPQLRELAASYLKVASVPVTR